MGKKGKVKTGAKRKNHKKREKANVCNIETSGMLLN